MKSNKLKPRRYSKAFVKSLGKRAVKVTSSMGIEPPIPDVASRFTQDPERLDSVFPVLRRRQKQKCDVKDLAIIFHTATRKACDSTESSLIWNLINDDKYNEPWEIFYKSFHEQMEKSKYKSFHVSFEKAIESIGYETRENVIFSCALELFWKTDLEGMQIFIKDCVGIKS